MLQNKTKEIQEFIFGLNGGEVKACRLDENAEYFYRAIVEDEGGNIYDTSVEWKKVTTPECQPIGNF